MIYMIPVFIVVSGILAIYVNLCSDDNDLIINKRNKLISFVTVGLLLISSIIITIFNTYTFQ